MDTLAQKKKALHLPAVLALTATTTVIAVVATLVLGSGTQVEAAEVDLSTDTVDGSIINAEQVLAEGEALLATFASDNDLEMAPAPAQSLCFFVREASDEGFIEPELACGPVLYPVARSGTYLSLPLDFEVGTEGVTASIAENADFSAQDYTSRTLFRPDGVQPAGVTAFPSIMENFDENMLPISLWDMGTRTPIYTKVDIGDTEPLPDFDGPVSTETVNFGDGSSAAATVTEALIVNSVVDPNTGVEYVNAAEDSVWVLLTVTEETPYSDWVSVDTYWDPVGTHFYITERTGPGRYEYENERNPGDTNRHFVRVPTYDDDGDGDRIIGAVELNLRSDALNIQHYNPDCGCNFSYAYGYTVEGEGEAKVFINETEENRKIWDYRIANPETDGFSDAEISQILSGELLIG